MGDAKVWVFGGSTAWGTGVPDDGTGGQSRRATGASASELGEAGYDADQSLKLRDEALRRSRPSRVRGVYDGVDEVEHKCRNA